MKKKVYLMMDYAMEFKDKVSRGEYPPNFLFGCFELEREGRLKILDQNLKNIIFSGFRSIFLVNRIKNVILLKLLGKKVIYINLNSNHDIDKIKEKGIKNNLLNIYYRLSYLLCDKVICLSPTQVKRLREIGVKKIKIIPLGVDENLIKKNTSEENEEYYLSAGLDEGKNFDFIRNALINERYFILNKENRLPYPEYLKKLSKCRALILNILDKKGASDLSGITTSCESLLMDKPVFINYRPWLKKLLKSNYYVYNDEKSLKKLLKKDIKFKPIKKIDYLTLKNFTKNLTKEINDFL